MQQSRVKGLKECNLISAALPRTVREGLFSYQNALLKVSMGARVESYIYDIIVVIL